MIRFMEGSPVLCIDEQAKDHLRQMVAKSKVPACFKQAFKQEAERKRNFQPGGEYDPEEQRVVDMAKKLFGLERINFEQARFALSYAFLMAISRNYFSETKHDDYSEREITEAFDIFVRCENEFRLGGCIIPFVRNWANEEVGQVIGMVENYFSDEKNVGHTAMRANFSRNGR